MNTPRNVDFTRSSILSASTFNPMVFEYDTPEGRRYHVDGKGFVAKKLRDATRYHVDPSQPTVRIDPFVTGSFYLAGIAVVEIDAIEKTAIRASWGDKSLVLSPTDLYAESFNYIRQFLGSMMVMGPYGCGFYINEKSGIKSRGATFNVAFQLPPRVDELLTPYLPSGSESLREIVTRIALLGFKSTSCAKMSSCSVWQRVVGEIMLRLVTAGRCRLQSIALHTKHARPVKIDLVGRKFADVYKLLAFFIFVAKSESASQAVESFSEIFGMLPDDHSSQPLMH